MSGIINGTYLLKDAAGDAQPINGVTVKAWRATPAFYASLSTNPPQEGTAIPVGSPAYTTATGISAGGEGAFRLTGVTPGGYWLSFEYGSNPVVWEFHRIDATVNVLDYGAIGDGTTDDTAAIQAAITAVGGTLYFPTGIYLISSTINLKSNLEIRGPGGGAFAPDLEHPSANTGACLKWGGATSGTMVSAVGCQHVVWDGVDLDGVDYANNVTGFKLTSTNAPASFDLDWHNFRIYNVGTGLSIGDPDYQTDNWQVSQFRIYLCTTGIRINSTNGNQDSVIRNGGISTYDRGIWLERSAFMTIENVAFGIMADTPTNAALIDADSWGDLNIRGTQGEIGGLATTDASWSHLRMGVGANLNPINFIGNHCDQDILMQGNCIFNSVGNLYAAQNVILNGADSQVVSIGDSFTTGGFTGSGVNRHVTRIGTYTTSASYTNQIEILIGGVSKFKVDNTGAVYFSSTVDLNSPIGGLRLVAAGANQIHGTSALATGTTSTTITNSAVKTGAYIIMMATSAGFWPRDPYVSAISNAISFTITHTNVASTPSFEYWIINPVA